MFSILRREDVDCSHPFTISPSDSATCSSPEDTLPSIDLKAYARRGAEARIAELTAELNDIYKAFPDLRRGGLVRVLDSWCWQVVADKRRAMSAAQKAEVSKRMKAYWAREGRRKVVKADAQEIIENRLPRVIVFLCPACGNRWSAEEPGAEKQSVVSSC